MIHMYDKYKKYSGKRVHIRVGCLSSTWLTCVLFPGMEPPPSLPCVIPEHKARSKP